jgi:putative transposase
MTKRRPRGCLYNSFMPPKFDPQVHHRRSIRLQGYDYCVGGTKPGTVPVPGAYFVTVVTFQRECLFGEIVNGE